MGVPQNGFIVETIKMDDLEVMIWGYPHFRKHPYACSSSAIFPRLPLNPSHLPPSSERAPQELSPYIRFGEISVKFIYAAAKQYAQRIMGRMAVETCLPLVRSSCFFEGQFIGTYDISLVYRYIYKYPI